MLAEHFAAVLWVTGAITTTPVLQFLAPRQVLALMYRIELTDEAGLFLARHWGLLAASVGGLLMARHIVTARGERSAVTRTRT